MRRVPCDRGDVTCHGIMPPEPMGVAGYVARANEWQCTVLLLWAGVGGVRLASKLWREAAHQSGGSLHSCDGALRLGHRVHACALLPAAATPNLS